jgi:hypothetical protein
MRGLFLNTLTFSISHRKKTGGPKVVPRQSYPQRDSWFILRYAVRLVMRRPHLLEDIRVRDRDHLIHKFVKSVNVDMCVSCGTVREHDKAHYNPTFCGRRDSPIVGWGSVVVHKAYSVCWRIPPEDTKPHRNTTSCPRGQDFGQHIFERTGNRTPLYACERVSGQQNYGTVQFLLSLPPVRRQRGHASLLQKPGVTAPSAATGLNVETAGLRHSPVLASSSGYRCNKKTVSEIRLVLPEWSRNLG